jgi:hypothetical protein
LWDYRYEGALLRYLQKWIDQLRWQRLKPMEKLAGTLLAHLEGILNSCRTKVPMGVVEAVNGNIKALLPPRPRLSRHGLSAAEGTALGCHKDRIHRFPESRVECRALTDCCAEEIHCSTFNKMIVVSFFQRISDRLRGHAPWPDPLQVLPQVLDSRH